MDNKVLDEAVEVALAVRPFDSETLTVAEYLAGFDEEDREQLMRAALLAAMPVLLGPVVAEWREAADWAETTPIFGSISTDAGTIVMRALADKLESVYAPDLGGGK